MRGLSYSRARSSYARRLVSTFGREVFRRSATERRLRARRSGRLLLRGSMSARAGLVAREKSERTDHGCMPRTTSGVHRNETTMKMSIWHRWFEAARGGAEYALVSVARVGWRNAAGAGAVCNDASVSACWYDREEGFRGKGQTPGHRQRLEAPTDPASRNQAFDRVFIVRPASLPQRQRYRCDRPQAPTTHRAPHTPSTRSNPMKSLLAMVTLALAALILEEKARQLAGEAQSALGQAAVQAHEAKQSLTQTVGQQPWISLLIAGGLAYALATIMPVRRVVPPPDTKTPASVLPAPGETIGRGSCYSARSVVMDRHGRSVSSDTRRDRCPRSPGHAEPPRERPDRVMIATVRRQHRFDQSKKSRCFRRSSPSAGSSAARRPGSPPACRP